MKSLKRYQLVGPLDGNNEMYVKSVMCQDHNLYYWYAFSKVDKKKVLCGGP